MSHPPFIKKIRIRNFKSIQDETVEFANPLFLVGRNGSGKSNFLNALTFIADCMAGPLPFAYEKQQPLFNAFAAARTMLQIDGSRMSPLEISVEMEDAESGLQASYVFALSPHDKMAGSLDVVHEACSLTDNAGQATWFRRDSTAFESTVAGLKFAVNAGALTLPLVGGLPEFSRIYQSLLAMRVYAIDPMRVREERFFSNDPLRRDRSNTGSVLYRLQFGDEDDNRVDRFLQVILPVTTTVRSSVDALNRVTVYFSQRARLDDERIAFQARDVSDGTLNILGIIVAVSQDPLPSLIALEEPERYLHPGALGVVSDLIKVGAHGTQIIVTTQSPELLDDKDICPENVRVVEWTDEGTRIVPLSPWPIRVLQDHLMTVGELLRSNALEGASLDRSQIQENHKLPGEAAV